jgi:hypothetical protein
VVSPILICLLKVIKNASCAFIDLAQDETRVAGRSRVEIRRVRALLFLGHVVAQQSFLPGTVVRRLHPSRVALEEAVTLRRLIGRGNDDEGKLSLVVVGHSRFSEFRSCIWARGKKELPLHKWRHPLGFCQARGFKIGRRTLRKIAHIGQFDRNAFETLRLNARGGLLIGGPRLPCRNGQAGALPDGAVGVARELCAEAG